MGSGRGSCRAGMIYIAVRESRILVCPDSSPGNGVEGGAAL